MKKNQNTTKSARITINDLPLRGITGEELRLVIGGDGAHECTTGSGANCAADDCGPWRDGQSKCIEAP
jgi:hypothetical protein